MIRVLTLYGERARRVELDHLTDPERRRRAGRSRGLVGQRRAIDTTDEPPRWSLFLAGPTIAIAHRRVAIAHRLHRRNLLMSGVARDDTGRDVHARVAAPHADGCVRGDHASHQL